MNTRQILCAAALALVSLGSVEAAQTVPAFEDHDRIREVARTHAESLAERLAPESAVVRATAGRLDSRLRLPACPVQPQSFTVTGQTGMPSSVGVRCTEDTLWSLYVPVQVEVIADVIVLSMPGFRGDRLTADHVSLEPRDIARMTRGFLTDPGQVDEMVLKRQVPIGTVLDASMLERERIVHRGERVRLEAGQGPLAVSVEGEALADAARGDRVRVRNVSSGRVVEGIALGSGRVVMSR